MSNIVDKMLLDKVGVPTLNKFLDLASTRHKLIAGNVANVSTPGYKSKDIDFHAELKKAIGEQNHIAGTTTNEKHIPLGQSKDRAPKIITQKHGESNGINDVDIDKEVANMAENQIYFSIGSTLLAKKFEGLRRAIRSK